MIKIWTGMRSGFMGDEEQKRSWPVVLKIAAASTILVGSVVQAAPAPAVVGSFDASASANGFRLQLAADRSPVTRTPIDGGGPLAAAVLDTLGTSVALASYPYPGDLGLSGPSTGAGLIGAPSPPPYPFVARADFPVTPESKASFAGTELSASAGPQEAKASGIGGSPEGEVTVTRSISTAGVKIDGADVIATAESIVSGLRIGPLSIGKIHSTAKVILKPDGTIERASEVVVEKATANGRSLAVESLPGPGPEAVAPTDDSPLPTDELEKLGLEVTSLSKEDTEDGVVSAGFRITKPVDFGPGGTGGATVILGQVNARARGEDSVLLEPPSGTVGTTGGGDTSSSGINLDTFPVVDSAAAVVAGSPAPAPVEASPSGGFSTGTADFPAGITGEEAISLPDDAAPATTTPAAAGQAVLSSAPAGVSSTRVQTGFLFGLIGLGALLASLAIPVLRSVRVR